MDNNVNITYCKSDKDLHEYLQELHSKGFKWISGESISLYRPTLLNNGNATIYAYLDSKNIAYVNGRSHDLKCKIFNRLIKSEYVGEFKSMFKLNRLPSELSDSQQELLKSLKLEHWLWETT